MHLPTLVFLAPAAFCVLSWIGVGSLVPLGWLERSGLLDALTRVAFGSVAVSLGLLALGRVELFRRPLLVGLTAVAALVGVPPAWRAVTRLRRWRVRGRLERLLLAAVAVALLLDLAAATAPPTSADALKYHLALPRLWLQLGAIGDPFWRWEGFNPSSVEMLYGQGLALAGGSAAAALHAVFAALCAAAVYGLTRELGGGSLAALVAASLFTLQGIVTWEATSAFIELGLSFYVLLAVWWCVVFFSRRRGSAGVWAGACAGAAAGTKYLGLVPAALVMFAAIGVAVVDRRPFRALSCPLAALLVGGAWYLKNLLVAGNPLYPNAFGGKWMTPYAHAQIHASLAGYGVGGGLLRLVILPLDLAVHGGAFDRGQYVGTAVFVLAVLALLVRRRHLELVVAAGAALYLVAWHQESPQARFLLPALGVLAALGGLGAADWLMQAGWRRVAVLAVLGGAAALWLASSGALTRQLLPVAFGAEAPSAFVQRLTGTRGALVAARRRAGAGTIGVAGYDFVYDVPGRAVDLGVPEFVPSLTQAEMLRRLETLGVRSIVVGGGLDAAPQLAPIWACLRRTGTFKARFVTSRSLGTSIPYDFATYSLSGCRTR